MSTQVVVLVPGLFGFESFGHGAERISYFDQVAARLALFTEEEPRRIVVHKPPPTGALAWRVQSLFDLVRALLRDGHQGQPVDRVHLVGHSTGGVDVRLLMNSRYGWPGAPSGAERTAFFPRVGAVISLSAPHRGSPIARRLRGTLEAAIPQFYLVSILAKQGSLDLRDKSMLIYSSLLQLLKGDVAEGVRGPMSTLPPSAAAEVARFLDDIVEDRALIHDLTPLAMRRLNAAIEGGEWPRLRCYVTAAPRPGLRAALTASLGLQALQWAFYAAAFGLTEPSGEESQPFPGGPWIGTSPLGSAVAGSDANDGVVPSGAQVVSGAAAGLVEGDHVDVVGHFTSKRFAGTTVFKSGSGFDDERFDALWRAIANDIKAARVSTSSA